MRDLENYNFNGIYELAMLIDSSVTRKTSFWNYDTDLFIFTSSRFSKFTLLHHYTVITALNFYRREFKKDPDYYEEEEDVMEFWYELFKEHRINIRKLKTGKVEIYEWFKRNENKFEKLFEKMANELFYVLFSNRGFLLKFNLIVAECVADNDYPTEYLNEKGKIKRVNIPRWLKNAVFHRDKGRCVFCKTDLTMLINTLTSNNFDHIVPLDRFGANDPCNIQLLCESCNKSKKNSEGSTSSKYISWW